MRSAAAAYGKDANGRSGAFGPDDAGWIAVTALVQHAAAASASQSLILLRDAVELSEAILGAALIQRDAADIDAGQPGRSDSEIIATLAVAMERCGALHLGSLLLEALADADRSLSVLELGRIQSLLGRMTWKRGELDAAEAIYHRVRRLGREHGEPELETRAANGIAAIMQVRGDYVSAKRWATKAGRLARRYEFPELQRIARYGLMVLCAKTRDFDAALVHGWAAYGLSIGDAASMDELLTNLGQLLLDVGYPDTARAAFTSVLSRPQPPRIGLPALGGLAGAAARVGDRTLLDWAAAEVLRQSGDGTHLYEFADALRECAAALASVGESTRAAQCSTIALGLAERFGYRDVQARAEALLAPSEAPPSERLQLAPRALRVARQIQALGPARLPDRIVFAAVA